LKIKEISKTEAEENIADKKNIRTKMFHRLNSGTVLYQSKPPG
jgi:hypothetical protein